MMEKAPGVFKKIQNSKLHTDDSCDQTNEKYTIVHCAQRFVNCITLIGLKYRIRSNYHVCSNMRTLATILVHRKSFGLLERLVMSGYDCGHEDESFFS